MEYKNVTETIIGCAYRVYNKMGFGFLDKKLSCHSCLSCQKNSCTIIEA